MSGIVAHFFPYRKDYIFSPQTAGSLRESSRNIPSFVTPICYNTIPKTYKIIWEEWWTMVYKRSWKTVFSLLLALALVLCALPMKVLAP
jgi:hypothetical protein